MQYIVVCGFSLTLKFIVIFIRIRNTARLIVVCKRNFKVPRVDSFLDKLDPLLPSLTPIAQILVGSSSILKVFFTGHSDRLIALNFCLRQTRVGRHPVRFKALRPPTPACGRMEFVFWPDCGRI